MIEYLRIGCDKEMNQRNESMELRKATEKDIPVIIDLKMKMSEEIGITSVFIHDAKEKMTISYQELYQQEKCFHYIVYEEKEVVAIGGAILKDDIPFCFFKTPYYGFVVDVYCIPEKRKKGYATAIMEEIMKELKKRKVRVVRLKTSQDGKKLYQRFGFHDTEDMEFMINYEEEN